VQVSTDGGVNAVWAANGRELFYRNGDKMMVVPIEMKPSFTAGSPRVLFEGRYFFAGHDYNEQVELLSIVGNIADSAEGTPKLHAHVVLGCSDATTRGGHLIEAVVRPTLEAIIEETPTHLKRQLDAKTGLVLLRL